MRKDSVRLCIFMENAPGSVLIEINALFISARIHMGRYTIIWNNIWPSQLKRPRYLGLPTVLGRITNGMFDYLGKRVYSKMRGGLERMVYPAGKEIFLKVVIQAIPTFNMSYFHLTKKVCKHLRSHMTWCWWSSSLDRRSMHWVYWDSLVAPKCRGGARIKNERGQEYGYWRKITC
jgi:hypothetical protein